MERLNWKISQEWNEEIREYRSVFEAKITDSIYIFITYRVYYEIADNKWYLLPDSNFSFRKECNDPDTGKRMAEEELQKIFDGMRKLLDEDGMKEVTK